MGKIQMENPFAGPGRRTRLSAPEAVTAVVLLLLTAGVLCYALFMAARNRVEEILLDPYTELSIEGADGYGRASAGFDGDSFREKLEEEMLSGGTDLSTEEIHELAQMVSSEPRFKYSVEKADEDDGKDEKASYLENISNGDTVTLNVTISEEMQELMREKGFSIAFDCNPLVMTAAGLPKAEAYDPFAELEVGFSGVEGNGMASAAYHGQYPISFSCVPGENLHNGDHIQVQGAFSSDYDMDRFISDFQVVPSSLEKEYIVSGLLINPTTIKDFTVEHLQQLSERARNAAMILIKEDYGEDEEIVRIENAGMYYAYSGDNTDPAEGSGSGTEAVSETGPESGSEDGSEAGPESGTEDEREDDPEDSLESGGEAGSESGRKAGSEAGSGDGTLGEKESSGDHPFTRHKSRNFLVCAFRVDYTGANNTEMEYYYYIRYDNLVLAEDGSLTTDFTRIRHPEKSSTPIELLLGEGDDVALPGLLNFRTLAGFRSLDELYEKELAPLESRYTISSLIQP